ncbi:MAG: DUF72 domain-containing protein [Planctomycetota bacterium]
MAGAIRVGTSGWSYDDWVGPFYPPGVHSADLLPHYCRHFDTVEIDSTFYRPPSEQMVRNWAARTPEGFVFALKMPRSITHEKLLLDCDGDMDELLPALAPLRSKLRAILLQFSYFNRAAFASPRPFLQRLDRFLASYAARVPLACEIRNRGWLNRDYFELLRRHKVSATLVEHAWLPPIDWLIAQQDVVTGSLAYVRLIGDRDGIEKTTRSWGKLVLDRTADLQRIAAALREVARRADVLVYINNHYAGHGPASCRQLRACLSAGEGSAASTDAAVPIG